MANVTYPDAEVEAVARALADALEETLKQLQGVCLSHGVPQELFLAGTAKARAALDDARRKEAK